MEKIIATEVSPHGLDNEILAYLTANSNELKLDDAVVYYGFPVFKDYEHETIKSKILILSRVHGLVLLQTSVKSNLEVDDENLSQVFSFIDSAIRKSKLLRKNKKELHVQFESAIFCTGQFDDDDLENETITSINGIQTYLDELSHDESPLDDEIFDEARAIIEGSKALSKPSRRIKISDDPSTKLNILIELEKEVSNFDIDQRKIAISLINGPQRIRGLAGSGKTVVLAMKAAHIHLQHPDKKILFTFYTKSLYELIKESVSRFYRHFAGDEPNWEKIDILHAWGGRKIDGVYYNACIENSLSPIAFQVAKSNNPNDPFSFICAKLEERQLKQKYDYILIDEAQDLPNDFFKVCYQLAKGELGSDKNIVWAYDDLQSIFNVYQRTPEELFGSDSHGNPKVDLRKFKANLSYGQSNDLVLYKCYRNPLEVLVTAHAVGFGLYSEKPVQMLENQEHWEDVGYTVESGELVAGTQAKITRSRENSPLSIYQQQSKGDLVKLYGAASIDEECSWITDGIFAALAEGLKPHDILVISLDDLNARTYFSKISRTLAQHGVRSNNLLTSISAAPPFTLDDMVTLSTVHRAKGNEAPLVFAAGIDAIYQYKNHRSGRNKLFTAFTRTKAWLRVSGWGDKANYFFREIEESLLNAPSLVFEVPNIEEIETIQRDLDSKSSEIYKLHQMVGELRDQGFSEEEIQLELNLAFGKGE
ncbi:ATP-binding domain-containing protein [Pseudomonas alliivorans]|nr:ATP-binding domain-containing protein [Pseudomonas alliivorans]MEE4710626.1 ATP-binding domain-containing protein [Pseudomonas alliivorans]MEE4724767.1 ATP-binding domain-containing protein [Pseudomonas alliivorans]MEE4766372.1 ATP-binding domain-containing protein [Pseudomonas alliivorans]MEE5154720.1 ATP-binding domain-containing protein [Pseudomonas alliivorans]